MIIEKCNEPWIHYVIDELFDADKFQQISKYVTSKYNLETLTKAVLEIHTQSANTWLYQTVAPVIIDLKEKFFDELNFGHKQLPEVYYPYVELSVCPPGFRYHSIHPDTDYKLMSTVLYVSPRGDGTELYKTMNKNSLHSVLTWKQNRALTFVGQTKPELQQTWHNYGNSQSQARVAINMILSSTPHGPHQGR
jgi:asparagine N-glycosylation enzyme membrane subunit Stt3